MLSIGDITVTAKDFDTAQKLLEQKIKEAKLLKKVEKAKPVKVKYATPSSVKTKEGKYTVKETKTGRIKVTNPKGKTITLPKGKSVQEIMGTRRGGAGLGGMFGIKNR